VDQVGFITRICRKSSKIIQSRNTYLRLRFRVYTEILRNSCMVLKKDIVESVDSLVNRIGAWYLRILTLSVSHCAVLTVRTW
jgi:hypothetical protein